MIQGHNTLDIRFSDLARFEVRSSLYTRCHRILLRGVPIKAQPPTAFSLVADTLKIATVPGAARAQEGRKL